MIPGNGMRLRAIEKADLPRFVAWLNDPQVIACLDLRIPLSLAQEEAWFENNLKKPAELQPLVIEILLSDNWVPIGNLGFNEIDWMARSCEVGIFIGDKTIGIRGWVPRR